LLLFSYNMPTLKTNSSSESGTSYVLPSSGSYRDKSDPDEDDMTSMGSNISVTATGESMVCEVRVHDDQCQVFQTRKVGGRTVTCGKMAASYPKSCHKHLQTHGDKRVEGGVHNGVVKEDTLYFFYVDSLYAEQVQHAQRDADVIDALAKWGQSLQKECTEAEVTTRVAQIHFGRASERVLPETVESDSEDEGPYDNLPELFNTQNPTADPSRSSSEDEGENLCHQQ
jgi:hypothetical protein